MNRHRATSATNCIPDAVPEGQMVAATAAAAAKETLFLSSVRSTDRGSEMHQKHRARGVI